MAKQRKAYNVDYRYSDGLLSKFVNMVMLRGKKSVALTLVYGAIDYLSGQVDEEPLEAFRTMLSNIKPALEVKSRRVGGATYQVPVEVSMHRQNMLAMRWIIAAARKRSGKSMQEKLGMEMVDAHRSTGAAYKKKEETHRMAEANKAFSHYR